MNRRKFLQTSASLSAAALSPRLSRALAPAAQPATTPLRQLDYSQVQLLDSPLRVQFDHNHALFLSLDDDRLLKPFRQLTGMPAPGEDMGGWYSPSPDFDPPKNFTGYVPGHTFGQWVSALSRMYAATGDKATQQKVHALVRGYAATVSPKFYADYCLPCYTFDKIVCGLIDAHQFAQDPIALSVLDHATGAVMPYLPPHALTRPEMAARPHPNIAYTWDESYTLPENLYLAHTRGAGPRFHTLAQRFLQDTDYFTPLSQNKNALIDRHAYSHVNALSSAMQAYLVDSSDMHLTAARNGLRFVIDQSFATGGWGPNEGFVNPASNGLADSLTHTHASFETPCGSYGHFKITRYLLRVTADPLYGDSMETVLYNTILGARLIQPDGTSFYYSDYNDDAHKFWHNDKWPCCSGTFPQVTADYGISSYFATPRGLAVNLYHPSRVSWKQGSARITLTQSTAYPNDGDISLALTTDRPTHFPLQLRIPAWAGPATRVRINGRPDPHAAPQPGTWLTLDREWRSNDRVELTLDMPLRLIPLDANHPNLVALARGPAVLFALLPAPESITRHQLLAANRIAPASNDHVVTTETGQVDFRPFTAITDEHYRLYHQI
ncbi:MAG TPA: beta-L-arabinofuranosidase domain-containing protein [Acidobacteriaceae bacterium]|nr:beta-L-arabinofuranosidase domain-containing protein [Acidobacteriaceae bacterium]